MNVETKIRELEAIGDSRWAWANYLDTVRELIALSGAQSVIEIGGGRAPSFTEEEVAALNIDYTSNDISERELARAPKWVGKAHFDVQTADERAIAPYEGRFDLAFSKMVMEHVASYERAYTNLYRILKPGGVSIAFHPVLFAFPFVVNKFMPEAASARILETLFPNRNDEQIPKFPASYSGCVISQRVRNRLKEIGFKDVWQVPFYGHGYYNRFPGGRTLQQAAAKLTRRAKATSFAAYAFTIARK